MKLNNKGMTLIEIIISIALISIVLIFIFSLLVTVNQMNSESKINSSYLITKALMIKGIEDNLNNSTKLTIKSCGTDGINNLYNNYGTDWETLTDEQKAGMCIGLDISRTDGNTTTGKLGIYYYKPKGKYVISYITEDGVRLTKELPDFENSNTDYNETPTIEHDVLKTAPTIKFAQGTSNTVNTHTLTLNSNSYHEYSPTTTITIEKTGNNYAVIEIPIIGEDGKDYTYLISYYAN